VDTASYSNVRRFLNQGQPPPKDAVRIEELINYFSYSYPEPRDGKPFTITTAIGECPWNARHRLALVGLQARHLDSESTPPRNLVFLIDTSGSMFEPNKLPLVKASLAMLVRNLTGKDRVAIVAYAGQAGLVLPATSGADTETILEAIARLEAGGSTNGAGGIVLAYEIAQKHFIKGGVNRVVLSTDGDFNVGVTSQGDLIRLIEKNRESGVALSVLGFGMGNLKDSTMEKLADKGNGNYAYIDSLQEAQKVLVEQAGGTLVTVAKDVKLQVEFNPRVVGSYRLIGYEKRILEDQDFNNDRKDAGDMGAGHSVTALFELAPVGEPVGSTGVDPLKYQQANQPSAAASADEAMTVKVRYKQPDGDTSTLAAVAVKNSTAPTSELGFASAVAEFGMLLRDSEHKGSSSFADVRERASRFKGNDPFGHRAEFIRLIDAAEGVNRVSRRD
jgi:Ca-activated chloride channel family protein